MISADDVVSDAFRSHTRQNEGITETYIIEISWSANMCNQAQVEKGTFQQFEIYKHDSAQQFKKSSVIWQF